MKINAEELKYIVELHNKWLNNEPGGEQAGLYDADLREDDLRYADLSGANLSWANLRYADLSGANLYGADLSGAKNAPFIPMACPDHGRYTAFKKVPGDFIVVLEIPEDAIRSSATTRKCRSNKAIVKAIENLDGTIAEGVKEVRSKYDKNFVYRIGETVEVKNFDGNRYNECAPGIHHFINREEAVMYNW